MRVKVIAGAVIALLMTGGIVALARSGGGRDQSGASTAVRQDASGRAGRGDLAVAAAYLGLARSQLRHELASGKTLAQVAESTTGKSTLGLVDALVSAKAARLTQKLAAGGLKPERQKLRLASIRSRVTDEVAHRRWAATSGAAGHDLNAAASYLGTSPAQLRSDLRSGRTLAQIASSTRGKSPAGLIDALVAERKARLDREVADGTLTRKRESALLSTTRRRVTDAVNRPRHGRAPAAKRETGENGRSEASSAGSSAASAAEGEAGQAEGPES